MSDNLTDKAIDGLAEQGEELIRLCAQVAVLTAERDKAQGYLELSNDAHDTVRRLLNAHGVPMAAFIDDHVGNAIAQRNQAIVRGDTYKKRARLLASRLHTERKPIVDGAALIRYLKSYDSSFKAVQDAQARATMAEAETVRLRELLIRCQERII